MGRLVCAFQESHGYTQKRCLEKKKQNNQTEAKEIVQASKYIMALVHDVLFHVSPEKLFH